MVLSGSDSMITKATSAAHITRCSFTRWPITTPGDDALDTVANSYMACTVRLGWSAYFFKTEIH